MKLKKVPLIDVLTDRYDEYTAKELYSMIMCGEIKVSGETIRNARQKVNPENEIILASRKWVSRGGEKLVHAVSGWKIEIEGKVILDAGSSTGGFTDCLLQHGAALVHAVDVGYNQLDYKLRTDARVNVLERTNIMSVSELEPPPDFAVADLSFRSITGAAAHILEITNDNLLIALVKPQFELPETEDFDGVIRDKKLLNRVLLDTAAGLENESVRILKILKSPIKGGKGNTEFLFQLKSESKDRSFDNTEFMNEYLSINQF